MKALFVFVGLLALVSCGGGSSSSGPAAPLPTDQYGSITNISVNSANCYISDDKTCSAATYLGAGAIKSMTAAWIGTSPYLFWGDSGGHIYSSAVSTTSPPSTINSCLTSISPNAQSLTIAPSTSTYLYYSSAGGGTNFGTLSSISSTNCSYTNVVQGSSLNGYLAYNPSTKLVIGVTSTAQYYSCVPGAASCTSQGLLTNLQDASPSITAIASDPLNAVVYILSIGSAFNRIYAYLVNSNGTLSYITSYTGLELSNPSGITVFQGNTLTQTFCTGTPCIFMDVTNPSNTTITQYVVSVSTNGSIPTGVSINQFNNPYFNCDLIQPSAIASLPGPLTTGGLLNTPNVFVGENGFLSTPCLNLTTGTTGTYGNNITAYTVLNE